MKIFFDTPTYVAEALLGEGAEKMLAATEKAGWRIYSSPHVLTEVERVLTEYLGCSRRLAVLTKKRIMRRTQLMDPGASHHEVPQDAGDSPILRAAMTAGVDYLVTNDAHLLALNPYEGLRIISMAEYHELLIEQGLLHAEKV